MPSYRLVPMSLSVSRLGLGRCAALALALGLGLAGCTAGPTITRTQTKLRRITDFRTVDMGAVTPLLKAYRTDAEEAVLYRLERGAISHYRGKWAASVTHFQRAERAIKRHYALDVTQNLQSLLVNDQQLPYDGERYESIYLTIFNCLNYLHQDDIEGALVEMRQIQHKLALLNDRQRGLAAALMKRDTARAAVRQVDNKLDEVDLLTGDAAPPELRQNSALGRFFTAVLYGKTGRPDDARIALQKLRTALADQGRTAYPQALGDVATRFAAASPPEPSLSTWPPAGNRLFRFNETLLPAIAPAARSGIVSVPRLADLTRPTAFNTLLVSFTGRGPRKVERSFTIPVVLKDESVPLHFAVPVLKRSPTQVSRVRALVGRDTVQVPMIEDMQAVARTMFEQEAPILYTRAVIRSVLKAGLTEGAEHLAETEGSDALGFLVEQVGRLMSSQAAQADTRGWQTMPGRAHALAVQLPAGTHEVTVEYLSGRGRVVDRHTQTITVQGPWDLALAESISLN